MYVLTVAQVFIISKILNPVNMLQKSEAFARSLLVVHLDGGLKMAKAQFPYCKCQKESTRALTQVPKCQLSQRESHPQLVKSV